MNTYPYTVILLMIGYLYIFYNTLFLISGVDIKCK